MSNHHLPAEKWTCPARSTADPPQDCNWPFCGCDDRAGRVIEALLECGWIPLEEAAVLRTHIVTLNARITMLETANQLNKETIAAMQSPKISQAEVDVFFDPDGDGDPRLD